MLGCQSVQHVDSAQQRTSIRHAASKAKEKIRINSLQLLHFDSRDDRIIQESFQQVMDFSAGFHLLYGLTTDDILAALKAAHTAADEYYTVRHALAWNRDFVILIEAIEADSALFQSCGQDFAAMCRHKQQLLAHNRLSPERIFSIFGSTGQRIPGVTTHDFNTLLEFATNGITPLVSPGFKPESVKIAPLRDRYLKLHHTIDKLLYKLYNDGTMIFLRKQDALRTSFESTAPR